jgi:hypothetical protein
MKIFFNATFTDLGPFRAIKYDKLLALNMEDKTYGWTVEMQLKVLKQKCLMSKFLFAIESGFKVSGTVKGVMAGIK